MAASKDSSNAITHECFYKCDSLFHGSNLTAALSKDELTDEKVAAYLKWCCVRYSKAWDLNGRNLLHVAASKGRLKLLLFLLKHKNVNINEKDKESHYTPLHRSVYYGQIHCAVRLIQHGANMHQFDLEDLTPIDLALKNKFRAYPGINGAFSFEDLGVFIVKRNLIKERPSFIEYNERQTEVYMWGTNINYNLGTGHHQSRTNPVLLDAFGRHGISIKTVLMSEYHSVFVSYEGQVWSCGHGPGGRLGLDDEMTTLIPKVVNVGNDVKAFCIAAALGNDHTLLLLKNKTIWSFGLNNYHQLGHYPPPEKILAPKMIKSFKENIIGVSASKYHSVFWSKKQLFTCGLNGGQLGHKKGPETVACPKPVPILNLRGSSIAEVASSEGAIVLSDEKGQIYLLNKFACKKIMSSSTCSVAVKICVIGGHLDCKLNSNNRQEKSGEKLKILVLFENNMIYWWQESGENYRSSECSISLRRKIEVTDIALNKDFLLLTTSDGEAFQGEVKTKKLKAPSKKEELFSNKRDRGKAVEQKWDSIFRHVHYINLKKIPNVHRGIKVTSDPKGRNFAVIQIHPRSGMRCIPEIESSDMKENMKALLESAENSDNMHDVVFEVEGIKFLGHRFIIFNSCPVLENKIKKGKEVDGIPFVKIDKMRADIFRRILFYLYTGDCDLLQLGLCPIRFNSKDKVTNIEPEEIIISDDDEKESKPVKPVYENKLGKTFPKKKNALAEKKKNALVENKNPLKLLKRAAKKFGLTDLKNKIENVKYRNGYIRVKDKNDKENYTVRDNLRFNREKYEELCDISVKSDDGIEIKAHKCILVSRLEYCNALINHQWLESSEKASIKIPISGRALRILINYLYTDEAHEILTAEDPDLSSMMLVIADQFFCNRLKEFAEFSLSHLLSLRNAPEIFQLATTYNANQLKQCAMEFISLNLATFLEIRTLEILQDSDLQELTTFYRDWLSCMRKRRIPTYVNAPDENLVEMIYKTEPVSLEYAEEDIAMKTPSKNKKKASKRKNNESERVRYVSTVSFTSEDERGSTLTDEIRKKIEEKEEWIKVVNHPSKQQKRRVRIPLKNKDLKEASPTLKSPKLNNLNKIIAENPKINLRQKKKCQEISTNSERDFPALNASRPERISANPGTSRQGQVDVLNKFVKLSQKQRKRLTTVAADEEEEEDTPKKVHAPVKSPWRVLRAEAASLTAIMKEESKGGASGQSRCGASTPGPQWQETPRPEPNLPSVIASQRRQKGLFEKMRSKRLEYTQLEDKAMGELLQVYNASLATDERITVKRADREVPSPPVWVPNRR